VHHSRRLAATLLSSNSRCRLRCLPSSPTLRYVALPVLPPGHLNFSCRYYRTFALIYQHNCNLLPQEANGITAKPAEADDRRRSHRSGRRSRSRSPHRRDRSRERRSSRHRSSRDRRSRSRERDHRGSRDHSERRSSRRSRSRSSSRVVRRRKKSNFDVRPPGVTEENAAAYAAQAILQQNMAALSGSVGPASFGASQPPAMPTGVSQPFQLFCIAFIFLPTCVEHTDDGRPKSTERSNG
jgi:hypothetical protein